MKRDVRVVRSAQRDLAEIAAYLRCDTPAAAERTLEELLSGIDRLGVFPESGPAPRDERLARLGFRYLARGRYLVFYKVTRSQVRVYRVLHQRRAYERLL
ncbi:MAG: type II toxin-antitoxin system RelE/ParE family toxin [Byssovorax sp.]